MEGKRKWLLKILPPQTRTSLVLGISPHAEASYNSRCEQLIWLLVILLKKNVIVT